FAAAGIAREQGRAIEDDADAATAVLDRLHLRDHVLEEQEGAVVDAGQAGAETAVVALLLVFFLDGVLVWLPFDAEGRIGQQVIEPLAGETVPGEAAAENDVVDVVALD